MGRLTRGFTFRVKLKVSVVPDGKEWMGEKRTGGNARVIRMCSVVYAKPS